MIDDIRIKFTDTGIQVPTTEEVLTEIRAQFRAIFPNINLNPSTPQGQLITMITALIASQNNSLMYLANQLNPQTASGQFQDAIGKIYFMDRRGASSTQVEVTCSGLQGTSIPAGSQIEDADGNVYENKMAGTIGGTGSIKILFYNIEAGPIACTSESIDTGNGKGTIRSVIQGWDTAYNEVAGITGTNIEDQQDFEYRRFNSVAANSIALDTSIQSKVLRCDDVTDCRVLDNRKDYGTTIDGVELIPHSIFVCVLGGQDKDIAEAIYSSISAGCSMNGNVEYDLLDPITAVVTNIKFARPELIPLKVKVTLNILPDTPSNYQYLVSNKMVDRVHKSVKIGDRFYASEFYPDMTSSDVYGTRNIQISKDGVEWTPEIQLNGNEVFVLDASDIEYEVIL